MSKALVIFDILTLVVRLTAKLDNDTQLADSAFKASSVLYARVYMDRATFEGKTSVQIQDIINDTPTLFTGGKLGMTSLASQSGTLQSVPCVVDIGL
jgi:hypothetical protein